MPIDLWLIDAFTEAPFAGNPAGVCLLPTARPAEWMQAVAREMNQAETAFLTKRKDGFDLRWFTPVTEVDLCGHATLASAHYLWAKRKAPAGGKITFHTRSGLLTASRRSGWISLDFPATPPAPCDPPPYLLDALKAQGAPAFKTAFDFMVVTEHPAKLRALKPDFRLLRAIETRGVILTSPSDEPGVDFISRFFAPASGIDEDPVTGSAHCALAPYWAKRLGKRILVGRQVSARGGVVRVEHTGDRVLLGGKAVTVVKGTLAE